MTSTVHAVLFDLDGTLHDRAATVHAYLRGHLDRFGHPEALAARFVELDDFGYRGKREVFTRLVEEYGLTHAPETLLADYDTHGWDDCALMPHAHLVLDALRDAGIRVGIVTNGWTRKQQDCLDALDLPRRADVVVISEQAGVRKPEPAIYRLALAELGVDASQALFVGDSPVNDVRGPQAVGMRAAFLPTGHSLPPDIVPDFILDDLRGVLDLVGVGLSAPS